MHWRVRAVEAETGAYDLILGADWLHEHRVLVNVFGRSISLEAPGGRAVLQFEGHPTILTLVHFVVEPPPEPEYEPESEPEEEEPEEVPEEDADVEVVLVDDEVDDEEPLGNGFLEVGDDGDVTDDEMLG